MSTTTPHKWAITSQEEHPTTDRNGTPTTLHHVHFKTASGVESHVTLADEHYSAENVHQAVNHKATEIEKVAHMTSENKPTPPGKE